MTWMIRAAVVIATVFCLPNSQLAFAQWAANVGYSQPMSNSQPADGQSGGNQNQWSPNTPNNYQAYACEYGNPNLANCCADNNCDPWKPSVYAGYSFSFTKLHLKESFEAYVLDFANNTQTLVPFDQDFELTPRVWLGARNANGLGVRASYWNYDHASNGFRFANNSGFEVPVATSTSVIFPATIAGFGFGDELSVSSSVKATTFDFEGTYLTQLGNLQTEFGGGLRHARSLQLSEAVVTPGPFSPAGGSLNWLRKFEGIGPMFSATGRLPIGQRGLYGIGAATVSFLFGEKTIQRVVNNDVTPPPNTGLPILLFEDSDEISGIYDVRIGVGHQRETVFGNVFAEGTYEGQLWTDLGSPTLTFAGFNSFALNLGVNF